MSNALRTGQINLPDHIDRLVVVSDLHAYMEPLKVIDSLVPREDDSIQVLAGGDYFAGGCDPVEVLEWLRRRVGECAVLGNHDEKTLRGVNGEHPPYSEAGAFNRLDEEQRAYLAALPHVLEVSWKGIKIRIMHGHKALDGSPVSWQSKPHRLLQEFADNRFALTIVGHTHFPFLEEQDGAYVANPGSVSHTIFGWMQEDGRIIPQSDDFEFRSESGIFSSFLSMVIDRGHLRVDLERFAFDREQALKKLEQAGYPNLQLRRVLLESGLIFNTD